MLCRELECHLNGLIEEAVCFISWSHALTLLVPNANWTDQLLLCFAAFSQFNLVDCDVTL
ncbi:hypothetical protein DFR24_4359 [Panacagrimonas perspica]|uniref:Uncharacterized protein n=1 Tax=Panacagrimonas perspica TaxID=381431 RepID=A0A4R7NYE1_9GAMM|nr:hypothetical protein DFR24_4359 [Panacagrimonas perspica]